MTDLGVEFEVMRPDSEAYGNVVVAYSLRSRRLDRSYIPLEGVRNSQEAEVLREMGWTAVCFSAYQQNSPEFRHVLAAEAPLESNVIDLDGRKLSRFAWVDNMGQEHAFRAEGGPDQLIHLPTEAEPKVSPTAEVPLDDVEWLALSLLRADFSVHARSVIAEII